MVKTKNVIESITEFINLQQQKGKEIRIYERKPNLISFFKKSGIGVELDAYKEIILQEETKLELGGMNKKSFSLVYPLQNSNDIVDGRITLIGPEINEITDSMIDFSIFILIGFTRKSEQDFDNLRQINFISNGIQGFMIRTIPRRFWCRISAEVVKSFSFELLGNAIMYLYKKKFGDMIDSMEILYISTYPDTIEKFIETSSDIRKKINERWINKIEEWKKRADCDYEWDCEDCVYIETCDQVRTVLEARKKIEK